MNTTRRYECAKDMLKAALKTARKEWGSFEFPELHAIPEHNVAMLQEEIEKTFNARKEAKDNPTKWSTCKGIVEDVYKAMSPFAKILLSVTKEGAAV